MKKIRLIIIAIIASTSLIIQAQTDSTKFEINWGQAQKPFENGFISNIEILSADCKNIDYLLTTVKNGVFNVIETNYLVKYDRNSNEYTNVNITSGSDDKLSILSHETIGNLFYNFSFFKNKKDKKLYLFVEIYDHTNLQKKEETKKIAEIDLTDKGSDLGDMLVVQDNGHFLFRYGCKSKKGYFYGLEEFNKNLEREWGTFAKAMTNEGVNIESNYKIDDEGNVYAIQRTFENWGDFNSHRCSESKVWVVCYPKDGIQPISQFIMLKDNYFIPAIQLSLKNNHDVVCAGIYGRPDTESAAGAFSFIIEPLLKKIKSINYKEFSSELKAKGYDAKKAEKGIDDMLSEKDFESKFTYDLNEIHYRADGGFDLVAEKYYSTIEVISNNMSSSYINHYYYDDLWVLNFNEDGAFKWVQKIPKYEYVMNNFKSLGSYCLFYDKDDSFHFLFNIANSSKTLLSFKTKSKAVHLKLDKNGNENFSELINDDDISGSFAAKYCRKISENEILLTCFGFMKRDVVSLGKITFGKKDNYFIFGTLKLK